MLDGELVDDGRDPKYSKQEKKEAALVLLVWFVSFILILNYDKLLLIDYHSFVRQLLR